VTAALTWGVLLLAATGSADDARARSLAVEVLDLAACGDSLSLARAAALVPDAVRTDPSMRAAAANRALADLLAAASLRERSAASPGGEDGLRIARTLREEALDRLRPLVRAFPEDPAVVRALAVYHGLGGRADDVEVAARQARQAGRTDPWFDFAELSAAVRGVTAQEAAPLLTRFVAGHPTILPPRMSLARVQLALGERDEALSTLDALLATDPDHEDAKVLKAELLAPPPVKMGVPVVPAGVPPPSAPGFLPRKRAPAGNDARPRERPTARLELPGGRRATA
jgi:tetratricopeptide (TPR) repeat protein